MTTIVTRAGKGAPLTNNEMDQNLINLNNDKAEVTYTNTQLALKANLASPTFTGTPTAPTPNTTDNSTQIATTAFVKTNITNASTAAGTSFNPVGNIQATNVQAALQEVDTEKVSKSGDTMTGVLNIAANISTPLKLSRSGATGQRMIGFSADGGATSQAYVGWGGSDSTFHVSAGAGNPIQLYGSDVQAMQATGSAANSLTRKDYVDAADALKAPLASPAFTGNPTAPTPATADNGTSIATTAHVQANAALKVSKSGDTITGNLTVQGMVSSGNNTLANGFSAINAGGRLDFTNDGGSNACTITGSVNSGSPATRWHLGTYNASGDTQLVLTRNGGTETWGVVSGASGASNSLQFVFNGSVKGEVLAAGGFSPTSSIRWKTNVQESPYGLQTALALRPVTFAQKDGTCDCAVGFIAEDIHTALPVAANVGEDGQINGYDPNALIAVLVNAVKELSAKLASQQEALDAAVAEIAALKAAQ